MKKTKGMKLKIKNLQELYEETMENGLGIIIDDPNPINVKDKSRSLRGIYSPLFGTVINGETVDYSLRYSCKCGDLIGKFYDGVTCEKCGQTVEHTPMNINKIGWIEFDKFDFIHPVLYQHISKFIGDKMLNEILKGERTISKDCVLLPVEPTTKNPFYNLGMIEFKERFVEIMDYFLSKNKKQDRYDFIMENIDSVFTNKIPVLSLHLRDVTIINDQIIQSDINKKYSILVKNSLLLNKEKKFDNLIIKVLPNLYDTQLKINEIFADIIDGNIASKGGHIRSQCLGNRVNFSSRLVIVPMMGGHINEIELPYLCFLELYKFELINLLRKFDRISITNAYKKWSKAQESFDERIYQLMVYLIENTKDGLWCIVNRNPRNMWGL